jgi:hypothetical protein
MNRKQVATVIGAVSVTTGALAVQAVQAVTTHTAGAGPRIVSVTEPGALVLGGFDLDWTTVPGLSIAATVNSGKEGTLVIEFTTNNADSGGSGCGVQFTLDGAPVGEEYILSQVEGKGYQNKFRQVATLVAPGTHTVAMQTRGCAGIQADEMVDSALTVERWQ